jgi:hypothetical protein
MRVGFHHVVPAPVPDPNIYWHQETSKLFPEFGNSYRPGRHRAQRFEHHQAHLPLPELTARGRTVGEVLTRLAGVYATAT